MPPSETKEAVRVAGYIAPGASTHTPPGTAGRALALTMLYMLSKCSMRSHEVDEQCRQRGRCVGAAKLALALRVLMLIGKEGAC